MKIDAEATKGAQQKNWACCELGENNGCYISCSHVSCYLKQIVLYVFSVKHDLN